MKIIFLHLQDHELYHKITGSYSTAYGCQCFWLIIKLSYGWIPNATLVNPALLPHNIHTLFLALCYFLMMLMPILRITAWKNTDVKRAEFSLFSPSLSPIFDHLSLGIIHPQLCPSDVTASPWTAQPAQQILLQVQK